MEHKSFEKCYHGNLREILKIRAFHLWTLKSEYFFKNFTHYYDCAIKNLKMEIENRFYGNKLKIKKN